MIRKPELIEYFYEGIKSKDNLKIGVEHEKFVLNKNTFLPVSYYDNNGIKAILEKLVTKGWKPFFDDNEQTIIALKKEKEAITLEPGGQIELSGAPLDNIHETCEETTNHLNELKVIGNEFNFILLGMGVEPNLRVDDFSWMPKQRYGIMKEYMKKVDTLGHHMMKRTCTNQVNLDFSSEKDMIEKFRIMLNLEAIATAMFSNSPFDQGKISKYKSLRSHFWHHTDPDRTGLLPFVFKKDFNFEKYTNYALNVPMYFINRNNKYINMTKYTFKDFIEGKITDIEHEVNLKDWEDHLSTLFPQVRLKHYLEIRSMDACNWNLICSQPAFWIGILYDDEISDKINEITEDWSEKDREYLNKKVVREGLQTQFKGKKLITFAQEFLELSKKGLQKRNQLSKNGEFDESIHVKELEKNLENGYSPADFLIDKYNSTWKKSVMPIYEEMIF
ncbi:glutamate--cysteine ligase [Pelagibacterales bacterium SAG-MED31]|nr:glutamate--cysteine ligase [Pelagibacterales bacterium SAG-MED31]